MQDGPSIKSPISGKCFIPNKSSFEFVDGLVSSALDSIIVLQIIIAKSHPVKLAGIKPLSDSLPLMIKNTEPVLSSMMGTYLNTRGMKLFQILLRLG